MSKRSADEEAADMLMKRKCFRANEMHCENYFEQTKPKYEPEKSADFEKTVVLTTEQLREICQKIVDGYEPELRREYEKVLLDKLADQHKTFLSLAQHQINEHYARSLPNYMS